MPKKDGFNDWIMSKKGRLKSMAMFLENYKIETGKKISQAEFDEGRPIMSLPFYAIESFLFYSNQYSNFPTPQKK